MRRSFTVLILICSVLTRFLPAQDLPKGFAPGERDLMPAYLESVMANRSGITTPPGGSLRTMAEWEEIQALVITWTSYPAVLRKIVEHAQLETTVIIHCSDSNAVKSNLSNAGIPLLNVKFLQVPFNSIWIRDYGANTVYRNKVDTVLLVDWIYNRPRPNDDNIPTHYANLLNVPLYQTTQAPNQLVHCGGNFMSDGAGTFFSSMLFMDENGIGNPHYSPGRTRQEAEGVISDFMGMQQYVMMTNLPYDDIHHIDMHMKLLDEETLLVGEYPEGISDGPQIEANLQYVLNNYTTQFGTPFNVIRVPMPPSTSGLWPNGGAFYRTYANAVFVNKTFIVPVYREEYDTTALRILRENLPGYNVVGIDCDDASNNSNLNQNLISQGGAIHCITHSVGVNDPLLIVHEKLKDTYQGGPYACSAEIRHRSGILSAQVYYTTDTSAAWQSVPMSLSDAANSIYTAQIPSQPVGSKVFYYIHAEAVNGKQQVRPITAPQGFFNFRVLGNLGVDENQELIFNKPLFPNPSRGITCIPFYTERPLTGSLEVVDMHGRKVETIFEGTFQAGESKFFLMTHDYATGIYSVVCRTQEGVATQKLMVR
jgi:agmatine deiminase